MVFVNMVSREITKIPAAGMANSQILRSILKEYCSNQRCMMKYVMVVEINNAININEIKSLDIKATI